jgi:hypothetical protein
MINIYRIFFKRFIFSLLNHSLSTISFSTHFVLLPINVTDHTWATVLHRANDNPDVRHSGDHTILPVHLAPPHYVQIMCRS